MVKNSTRRRPPLAVIFLLVLLPVAFLLAAVGLAGGPMGGFVGEAEVTAIALAEIGLGQVEVEATIRVENTMPVGVTVDRVAYDVYYRHGDDWVRLGRAERTEDFSIPGREAVSVEIAHEVETLSAAAMLLSAIRQGGTAEIRASGSVWVRLWPLTLEVPLESLQTLGL